MKPQFDFLYWRDGRHYCLARCCVRNRRGPHSLKLCFDLDQGPTWRGRRPDFVSGWLVILWPIMLEYIGPYNTVDGEKPVAQNSENVTL